MTYFLSAFSNFWNGMLQVVKTVFSILYAVSFNPRGLRFGQEVTRLTRQSYLVPSHFNQLIQYLTAFFQLDHVDAWVTWKGVQPWAFLTKSGLNSLHCCNMNQESRNLVHLYCSYLSNLASHQECLPGSQGSSSDPSASNDTFSKWFQTYRTKTYSFGRETCCVF